MAPESPATNPADLLALAVEVAAGAAALARAKRQEYIADRWTKSTATDVVTAADIAVDRYVREAIRARRPDDAVRSEEAEPLDGTTRVRWIVDPIDGTVNYLYGIPYYAVSLAAEVDGVVVAGVVHNPATDDVYMAVRGAGAFHASGSGGGMPGRRLTGSGAGDLAMSLVATGFGYSAARRTHQARVLAALAGRIRDIRRLGACSLDLCLAATGQVDAYYERGLHEWDYAAGRLVATEAGLVVSGVAGKPAADEFLVAAPPGIHAALTTLLAELAADEGP